jgi:ADP-heptose:LPS heptosyltransferase
MHLRRNVLIFHAGALGDFVLSWPLAMALSRIHPQSRIIYVTHGQKGALAEQVLRVESTNIEAGWHHLFGEDAGKLPPPARKMLERAHSIYSFIAAEGDAWSGAVRAAAPGVDLCCLEPRPAEGVAIHSVDHLLSQLESRKAVHEAVVQMVRSITERGAMNRKPVAKRVVIHPGSGSAGKCWPAGHFVEVCRRFRDEGFDVRALMGEVEAERWSVDAVARFGEVAAVRQLATYVDLLNELLEAEVFLGNDSGPGHLAGVIGVPAFTVFGPTDPVVWRPVGPNVLTLRQMPMDELEPARVFEWVTRQ